MFEIVTYCRLFFVVDDDDHDYEPGVGFKKLDYVWMFEHVTYRGLPLQVVQGEAGGRGELGHVHHLRQGHEAGVGEYKSQGKSESASGVWGIVQTSLAIIWAVGLIEIKNGDHFLTPTTPQNGVEHVCFMRLALLGGS